MVNNDLTKDVGRESTSGNSRDIIPVRPTTNPVLCPGIPSYSSVSQYSGYCTRTGRGIDRTSKYDSMFNGSIFMLNSNEGRELIL